MGRVKKIFSRLLSGAVEDSVPPPDVANLTYLIYFLLGAGVLLPWNSFITAVDYFDYLYPHHHIDRVFSVAYIFPCLVVLCLLTVCSRQYSSWARINGGLGLYLFAIVLVPIMNSIFIEADKMGSVGTYYCTVGALVLTGVADALVQGSLIGSAGELPKRYMQAVVSGTAASGVLVSFLRIATKAALPPTPRGLRVGGNLYFGVSAAFLSFCLLSFNVVHELPVMKYYQREKRRRLRRDNLPTSSQTVALTVPEDVESEGNDSGGGGADSFESKDMSSEPMLSPVPNKCSFKHVLLQVKWLAGSLTLIYVITLSLFPGFLSEDVSSAVLGDWYPVLLFASYNVFDLIGKLLTAVYIPDSKAAIIGGSSGRVLFIPLFASCIHGPYFFRTEAPVFLLTSLLGATNGYFTSCLMIVGPKTVPLAEAETAGIIMTVSLVLGLAVGSAVSWVWFV